MILIANRGTEDQVAWIAWDRFRETCHVNADKIVAAAWRGPLDDAAAVLADAHDRLGPVALEDTSTILSRGGDVAALSLDAQAAAATIDSVLAGWTALADLT